MYYNHRIRVNKKNTRHYRDKSPAYALRNNSRHKDIWSFHSRSRLYMSNSHPPPGSWSAYTLSSRWARMFCRPRIWKGTVCNNFGTRSRFCCQPAPRRGHRYICNRFRYQRALCRKRKDQSSARQDSCRKMSPYIVSDHRSIGYICRRRKNRRLHNRRSSWSCHR